MTVYDLYLVGERHPLTVAAPVSSLSELNADLRSTHRYQFKLVGAYECGTEPDCLITTSCIRMLIEHVS